MLPTELLKYSKGELLLVSQAELFTATSENNVPLLSLATISLPTVKSNSLKNCSQ
jgi:hypothetical protein